MAHTRCMLDKQGYTRTRPHAGAPTRMQAGGRTHKQICNTYCISTATTIRERASVLLYTYIACLFSESAHKEYTWCKNASL